MKALKVYVVRMVSTHFFQWQQNNQELTCITKGQSPNTMQKCHIYRYSCERVNCDEQYIAESAGTFLKYSRNT